jgi:sugar phosphate isomerase/epimerase
MNRRSFFNAFVKAAALCSTGLLSSSPAHAALLERFKLGIINDEVSYDLEETLRFLRRYKLSWIELRELWQEDHYITALTKKELQRVKDLLEKYQIKVSVIATYLYKCPLPGSQLGMTPEKSYYKYSQQNDVLKRAIEIAHSLDCRSLRVFSFWRTRHPQAVYRQVVDHLQRAVELSQKAGVRILLENETSCNVGTGAELKRIEAQIPSEFFGINWDPGNASALNEVPYPDGYEQLPADRIFHCHLKDIRTNTRGQEHPWASHRQRRHRFSRATPCPGQGWISGDSVIGDALHPAGRHGRGWQPRIDERPAGRDRQSIGVKSAPPMRTPFFGLRRQSAAATALWLPVRPEEQRAASQASSQNPRNTRRCRALLATALQNVVATRNPPPLNLFSPGLDLRPILIIKQHRLPQIFDDFALRQNVFVRKKRRII